MTDANSISPEALHTLMRNSKPLLIDVREAWEHGNFNIGGMLIPLGELVGRANEIPADADVIFYCEKGIRSAIAIQRLEGLGFSSLRHLEGGMKAWRAAGY